MKKLLILAFIGLSAIQIQAWFCQGETSLMKAAQKADIQTMQKLITAGEDVNAVAWRDQPHGGKPVLRYAIDSHSLEAVQLLLNVGANPNDFTESPIITNNKNSNMRNLSLLSHAVNTGAPIVIIKELIRKGAHIDGTPKICGDWTPLMITAYRGYTQAIEVLLSAGAEISTVNSHDNKTALDYAKDKNHVEIIKLLDQKKEFKISCF